MTVRGASHGGAIGAALAGAAGLADEPLAAEIRAFGRAHIAGGGRIALAELLDAVPGLRDRPVPLDAAIDVALRSESGSSAATDLAVARLTEAHPDLARAIRTAAVLSRALWTSEAVSPVPGVPSRAVPSGFGPAIGDGAPRYTLEALEGVGSSGAVYRAVDRSLSASGRQAMVAVKILHATRTDPVTRARFMDEASKARVLDHPHAVRVFDRGESPDGAQFIVYELVEGGDLHGWVSSHSGPVQAREAARMVERIAGAIQAAHSAGLVHLDLKPANVLVTRDGLPKVADFGLAMHGGSDGAASGVDRSIGTLAFMPPEQHRGATGWASPRADVYALGGILVWLLTGALPNGGTRAEIQRTLGDPPDAEGHAARVRGLWASHAPDRTLVAICTRALAPMPADRYATAGELAADLCAWREHRPIRWMRPGPVRTAALFARRRPATASLLIVCAASMAGAMIASERARSAAEARAAAEAVARAQTERADEVQQWKDIARNGVAEMYVHYENNKKTGLAADMLMWLWYLEAVYGPVLLDDPMLMSRSREARIDVVAGLAAQAAEQTGPHSMQTLHLRTLLAFLLARDDRLAEAEAVIAEVEPMWAARVDPGDPWMQDLEVIRLTVRAGLEAESLDGVPPTGEARTRLRDLERAIVAHVQRLKGQSTGLQLRRLALTRLRQLYGPACLADAKWEKWTVDMLRYLGVDAIEDRIAAEDDGAAIGAPTTQAGATDTDTGD